MTLIFAVENRLGLRFNKRRVSRDSVLCLRIEEISTNSTLWILPYSKRLFPNAKILEDISLVRDEDFIFLEENYYPFSDEKIERIYLYHWNRDYPFDEQLEFDIDAYNLVSSIDFSGKAHEVITEEIYEKIKQ